MGDELHKKKTDGDPYGYDSDSDTVRVGRHDLARLLLMFRSVMREQPAGSWEHMRDYDQSFEKLADAVDAGAEARAGARWEGPDLRMRCTTTEAVYEWPEGAPYDGGAPVTWRVPGYGAHAVEDESERHALCGFWWARGEGRRVDGAPDCLECEREVRLGAVRPRGRR